jgi:diacylglycerol kinase family enzyme
LLIIYNPNSGKKQSKVLIPKIEARLNKEKIPYKFKGTTQAGDTFEFGRLAKFEDYSALVVVGGDGSYHEVINGMLARQDGQRLPVAVVPNGSGNDLCTSIGVLNLEMALDYIVSATVTKMDLVRVLADRESEADVPEKDINKMKYCRYMDINSAMSLPAKINYGAKPFKACCGKLSYQISTIKLACCGMKQDLFEVEVDGEKVTNNGKENVNTILLFVTNG